MLSIDFAKISSSLEMDIPEKYHSPLSASAGYDIRASVPVNFSYLTGLCADATDSLKKAAVTINNEPELLSLFRRCAGMLSQSNGASTYQPDFNSRKAEKYTLFNMLVLISYIEKTMLSHERLGIPPEISAATFSDFRLWAEYFHERHGIWGLEHPDWLLNHLSGKIYRLGRLQFMMRGFTGKIVVFRHFGDGSIRAFAESGLCLRHDGHINGAGGVFDALTWNSILNISDEFIEGNPVKADGSISQNTERLRAEEWKTALSSGDPVLDVHIPHGERMDFESCLNSFSAAPEFFKKHFPGWKYKGFTCSSWLLDAQFCGLLPENSNIIRFQKLFSLYPVLSNGLEAYTRVFGEVPPDICRAPAETSLQRALITHICSGGHTRDSGGYILYE